MGDCEADSKKTRRDDRFEDDNVLTSGRYGSKKFKASTLGLEESDLASSSLTEVKDYAVVQNSGNFASSFASSRCSSYGTKNTCGCINFEQSGSLETEGSSSNLSGRLNEAASHERSSEEMESKAVETLEVTKRIEPKTKRAKVLMPSEVELEEFFATVEKESRDSFAKKYNFDFEKDAPLDGRYEWVRFRH